MKKLIFIAVAAMLTGCAPHPPSLQSTPNTAWDELSSPHIVVMGIRYLIRHYDK